MIVLHTSNKAENLILHLVKILEAKPLDSIFAKEVFLIQSQGMERWISQQLAAHFGLWGNYEFLFPGKFFSAMAERIDRRLNPDAFDRERILWRFEALLRDLDDERFAAVKLYLCGDTEALKRFQLARQLAQVFDQYQLMRPDMLDAWQQGQSFSRNDCEGWQRLLWQKLTRQIGTQHRGALWLAAIEKLTAAPERKFSAMLPERVSIFGVHSMPPLFIDFMQGLSRHIQVHLYLINPSNTYWTDLDTKKRLAKSNIRKMERGEKCEPLFQPGHPLLASLGQQGREFQEMLLESVQFALEFDSFESCEANILSNLERLQNDILHNRSDTEPLTKDGSVSFHACHSRMREVEVLKDQILHTLDTNSLIELRDIVVMAPDIQIYAPYIAAVFDDVPHAIADQSSRTHNQLLEIFIRFLRLSSSRFGWKAIIDLLEQPLVYPGFGLSETALKQIRFWVRETHIRWGRSAEHKVQLGLPALPENTWLAGVERLFMGYAMGNDREFIDGILPFADIEGSSAQALGGLSDYIDLLFSASSEFGQPKPLQRWAEQLFEYADRLFASSVVGDRERYELNEILSELADNHGDHHRADVTLEVIIAWLETTVSERKSSSGFLRGQITFCSILPMRSIPFKVIAMLGLNEGDFPRIDPYSTFDLLSHDFRRGDRSRRADDRYQFLEILLSARKKLIITYIGQSIQQNEMIAPSVIVSELLEIFQGHYQLSDLVDRHPLQPFSNRYFNGKSPLFSYSGSQCETARSLRQPRQNQTPWWQGEIFTDTIETIDLSEFFAFFRNPQKYFVQQKLSLRLSGIEAEAEEREPFRIDTLDAYQFDQEFVAAQLTGLNISTELLQARGGWLSGAQGQLLLAGKEKELAEFVALLRSKNMGARLAEQAIEVQVGGYRLVGKLANLFQGGSLIYRYSRLKGKDLLQGLLHHLIVNHIKSQETLLVCKDHELLFQPEISRAVDLEDWLEIYLAGQTEPSYFFVEPGFAYVKQACNANARKSPLDKAKEQLIKEIDNGFDAETCLLYRDIRNPDSLLDRRFERPCIKLLKPAWEMSHDR